jgi:hypothetical protein
MLLRLEQQGKTTHALGRIEVFGPELLFADDERAFEIETCAAIISNRTKMAAELIAQARRQSVLARQCYVGDSAQVWLPGEKPGRVAGCVHLLRLMQQYLFDGGADSGVVAVRLPCERHDQAVDPVRSGLRRVEEAEVEQATQGILACQRDIEIVLGKAEHGHEQHVRYGLSRGEAGRALQQVAGHCSGSVET